MQGLAQAQHQFDRRLPVDCIEDSADQALRGDAMEDLRADLEKRNDAHDISSAFVDHLIDADDDIRLLRAVADGNDQAAMAIIKCTLQAVAARRALRGA